MSKKEYGKGFTLEDLQAQRSAIWETRRQVGLTVSTPPAGVGEVDGPLWNAMERQDPLARASYSISSMFNVINAMSLPSPISLTSWGLETEPIPEQPTGRFQNLDFDL